MSLTGLIGACETEGALTPQTVAQCHVLRQYRILSFTPEDGSEVTPRRPH